MKTVTFRWWKFWDGQQKRIVNLEENKDGYWRKRTQKALKAAWKEAKGVEVEESN